MLDTSQFLARAQALASPTCNIEAVDICQKQITSTCMSWRKSSSLACLSGLRMGTTSYQCLRSLIRCQKAEKTRAQCLRVCRNVECFRHAKLSSYSQKRLEMPSRVKTAKRVTCARQPPNSIKNPREQRKRLNRVRRDTTDQSPDDVRFYNSQNSTFYVVSLSFPRLAAIIYPPTARVRHL